MSFRTMLLAIPLLSVYLYPMGKALFANQIPYQLRALIDLSF